MAPLSVSKAYRDIESQSVAHGGRGVDLVVALYDGAIDSIGQAELFMTRKEYRDCGRQCSRALTILDGLRETLDFEQGEPVASSLLRLYNSVTSKIIGAQTRRDASWLKEAKVMLASVREAWAELAARTAPGRAKAVTSGYVDAPKASAVAPSGAGVAAAV
ncbi:MAG: flagellar export chaperone FliS [Betaproteobacteria bacterium]